MPRGRRGRYDRDEWEHKTYAQSVLDNARYGPDYDPYYVPLNGSLGDINRVVSNINNDGSAHQTVVGDGGRISWDVNADGSVKPDQKGYEGPHFNKQ